ncbi:hypothetical protein TFLX_02053 [Thermoflexales bacterium]|nr:hypothetical protein TFLX_02053 [Thermoflexales bacterium]
MRENMVRTQVYLPREIYERLQKRAEENDLTLAVQIREALEDYLRHAVAEGEERVMSPDDPLLQLVGTMATGLGDGSINHDQYIYRRDWGDPAQAKAPRRKPAAVAVQESRPTYQAKPAAKRKRQK